MKKHWLTAMYEYFCLDITLDQIMPDSKNDPSFKYWLEKLKKYLLKTLPSACRIIDVTKNAVMFYYSGKTNGTGEIKVDMLISPYVQNLWELYYFLEHLKEEHQSRYDVRHKIRIFDV